MKNITVIFREVKSSRPPIYPQPLTYWLTVDDPLDERAIRFAIAAERAEDLGVHSSLLPKIADGIEIDLVYAGHIAPIEDWRN